MCATKLPTVEIDPAKVPKINEEQVFQAAKKIVDSKASGLDSIPNKAVNAVVKIVPNIFTAAYTYHMS